MEEFVQCSHLLTWKDQLLMDLFWSGLAPWISVGEPSYSLKNDLDIVLCSCESASTPGETFKDNCTTSPEAVQPPPCSQFIPGEDLTRCELAELFLQLPLPVNLSLRIEDVHRHADHAKRIEGSNLV